MTESTFLLVLATPGAPETVIGCDSVSFSVPDGKNGKNGGSIGIRRGHMNAMMALDAGRIIARKDEECVLDCFSSGGFALVEKDRVTVLTNLVQISQLEEKFRVKTEE